MTKHLPRTFLFTLAILAVSFFGGTKEVNAQIEGISSNFLSTDSVVAIYNDANEIFILPSEQLTMEEIVSYLAFCDLYIGVSFHGAITAFCYGNPVVGFDFVHNKKTRDL